MPYFKSTIYFIVTTINPNFLLYVHNFIIHFNIDLKTVYYFNFNICELNNFIKLLRSLINLFYLSSIK